MECVEGMCPCSVCFREGEGDGGMHPCMFSGALGEAGVEDTAVHKCHPQQSIFSHAITESITSGTLQHEI